MAIITNLKNLKKMKKLILVASLAIATSTVAFAQEKKPVAIKYYSTEIMDEIKATPEQRKQVEELVANYAVKYKEVKANTSLSAEEAKAESDKLTSARAKEYWKILNPEQTKYLKDKAKGN